MKNSNEMSNAVCDNCGALINSDCNSVTIEINQFHMNSVQVNVTLNAGPTLRS